jgi:hypothetical protein
MNLDGEAKSAAASKTRSDDPELRMASEGGF